VGSGSNAGTETIIRDAYQAFLSRLQCRREVTSCKYHPGRIQVALALIAMVGLNSRMAGWPGGDEPGQHSPVQHKSLVGVRIVQKMSALTDIGFQFTALSDFAILKSYGCYMSSEIHPGSEGREIG